LTWHSFPFLSFPFLSFPIQSNPVQSSPIQSNQLPASPKTSSIEDRLSAPGTIAQAT
jgi:hypothetical protein